MKRTIALGLSILFIVLSLVACNNKVPDTQTNQIATETKDTSSMTPEELDSDSAEVHTSNQNSCIFDFDTQVVYESDQASITALKFEQVGDQTALNFKFKNLTDKDVIFSSENGIIVINGLTMSVSIYVNLAAGKTSTEKMFIDSETLRLYGINKINSLSFNLEMLEEDSYNRVALLKDIVIKAKDYEEDFKQKFDSGSEDNILYDNKGIKLTYIGKDAVKEYNSSIDCLVFSVENTDPEAQVSIFANEAYLDDNKIEMYNQSTVNYPPNSKGYMILYGYNDKTINTLKGHIEIKMTLDHNSDNDTISFDKTL